MKNPRLKFSAAYSTALLAAALLLIAAVWVASMDASDERVQEVFRRQSLVEKRADSAASALRQYVLDGMGRLVIQPAPFSRYTIGVDSMGMAPDSITQLANAIQVRFETKPAAYADLPDYFIIFDSLRVPVFISMDLRELWRNDSLQLRLQRQLAEMPAGGSHMEVRYAGRQIVFYSRPELTQAIRVSHFVAGTVLPTAGIGFGRVVIALLIISPFILVLYLSAVYAITGRPLRPVEKIINEVEAITDGRSLHKRVAIDHSHIELARLATTLNEMMSRLETSFTTLRRFTADASHELNTPLAVLRADIERAMSSSTSTIEQMEALEEALREIRRMSNLVDSLLTLARADEGRLELAKEPVDLEVLVADVYETATLLAEEAHIETRLVLLEGATVNGDRDRLRQLFLNLVSNAIKYTAAGGTVELSLSRRLDGVAFSVRDTGIGIAAGDLPHIFDRFWRADRSRSRMSSKGGFGLGLPISQWIAQSHGGTLTAVSKLGRGSTFTVTLPIAADIESSSAQSGDASSSRGARTPVASA